MIYCPKCGARNPDESLTCAGCGASISQLTAGPQGPQVPQGPQAPQGPQGGGYQPPALPKPENYLVWSILATILCCLPAGIVSIVFAAKVDSQYYGGDYAGAADSSNKAKTWAIVSAAGWAVAIVFYIIAMAVIGIGSRHM